MGEDRETDTDLVLVALLTVRTAKREIFRAYEEQAARRMAVHGGALERAIVVPGPDGSAEFREVHIVRFPSAEAFAAYRADPLLAALAPRRAEAVVATEILIGVDGPAYGASTP